MASEPPTCPAHHCFSTLRVAVRSAAADGADAGAGADGQMVMRDEVMPIATTLEEFKAWWPVMLAGVRPDRAGVVWLVSEDGGGAAGFGLPSQAFMQAVFEYTIPWCLPAGTSFALERTAAGEIRAVVGSWPREP